MPCSVHFANHESAAGRQSVFKMAHQVFCNQGDSLFRADHRFKSGPLGAKLLLFRFFLTLGDLFKLRIDSGLFLFPQFDLRQDVVTENRRRAAVVTFDVCNGDIGFQDLPSGACFRLVGPMCIFSASAES